MTRTLIIVSLTILLLSCEKKVRLNVNKQYHGWIYIVEAKNMKADGLDITPNDDGIVYISPQLFNKRYKIEVYENGIPRQSGTRWLSYDGKYYPANPANALRYAKFYYPLNSAMNMEEDKSFVGAKGKILSSFEYLIEQGKIDTTLLW
nr:hypothetical protein [uncultured Chitinophaga sp.]